MPDEANSMVAWSRDTSEAKGSTIPSALHVAVRACNSPLLMTTTVRQLLTTLRTRFENSALKVRKDQEEKNEKAGLD